MWRGKRVVGMNSHRMHESTRRVLDFIRGNPGTKRAQIVGSLPGINVSGKLSSLMTMDLVFGERLVGMAGLSYYARLQPERVEQLKLRGPQDGPIGRSREIDLFAAWPEPYLSDIGVRSDGLQYRECPSRRGAELVYCYRRHA